MRGWSRGCRAMLGRNRVLKEIAARLRERHEAVTPPALVAQLNRDFLARGLIDYDGPDWRAKLEEYAQPLHADRRPAR